MNDVLTALGTAESEIANLRAENERLCERGDAYKKALHRLIYNTPSCVLAGVARNAEAQRPPEAVKYTGHGKNTGGLQQHSVGPEYPFITYKRGDF